jgi:hypothetical protein
MAQWPHDAMTRFQISTDGTFNNDHGKRTTDNEHFSISDENVTVVTGVTGETIYFMCLRTGMLQNAKNFKAQQKNSICPFLPHFLVDDERNT